MSERAVAALPGKAIHVGQDQELCEAGGTGVRRCVLGCAPAERASWAVLPLRAHRCWVRILSPAAGLSRFGPLCFRAGFCQRLHQPQSVSCAAQGQDRAQRAATKYSFPASVTTAETLEQVSLSGDRIDSMFPPGQITSDDRIIWQGASGLSPSLSASSLAGAESASRDGFFAGLLYGLAAGLFVPFLQGLSESHDSVRERRRAQAVPAG